MPRLFKTDIAAEATLKVFLTDIRSDADAVVFETDSPWEATTPLIWNYTDIRGESDRVVFFADNQWDADVKVFRTDVASDVEWLNQDKAGLL